MPISSPVAPGLTYPEWLANMVMVPKKNGSWRICIDFTTLNKFCPKDEYPLPCIDTLVDAAAGSEMLSMLDCFSGYHQIFMKKSDEREDQFHNTLWHILLRQNARRASQHGMHF